MSNIIDKIQLSGVTYTLSGTSSGGTNAVEVTQAEYDALVSGGTVDPTVFYIITDATPVDVSNYWTSAQTQSAITQATSGKADTSAVTEQISEAVSGKVDASAITSSVTSASTDNEIPTAKAVYDAIPTGGTGGGKAISAGTNISVTTGETADTINCTLPIVVGGNFNNCLDLTYGSGNENSGSRNVTLGAYTKTTNNGELAIGRYNVSNTSSVSPIYNNPNKTVFSVGNGTADNARHNAFEIRQNGDIYLTKDGQDVKLQDQLGGGGIDSGTVQTMIDESISGKVDTSAITSSVTSASTDSEIPTAKAVFDAIPTGGTGGGKAIEAGRGISVTTGETADTVSFNLPIFAGTASDNSALKFNFQNNISSAQLSSAFGISTTASGRASFAIGGSTYATGDYSFAGGSDSQASRAESFAFGYIANANAEYSQAFGLFTKTNNTKEAAFGCANVSNTGSTTSAQTLFSVGNGTNNNTRHNAFEIRQNGDIYLNDGSKLQDTVSATTANTTALGGLSLVKLTQSAYDALTTKDENTIYYIVN